MIQPERKQTSIVLPLELRDALDRGARKRDMTRSQVIREAARAWLQVNGIPEEDAPTEKAS